MNKFTVQLLSLSVFFASGLIGAAAWGAEVRQARFTAGIGSGDAHIVLTIAAKAFDNAPTEEFSLDQTDCFTKALPVTGCSLKLIDHYDRYRYGQIVSKEFTFSLRDLALAIPAYSNAVLTVFGATTSKTVHLPVFNNPQEYELRRLRWMQTKYPDGEGFSNVTTHDRLQNYLFGVTAFLSDHSGLGSTIIAYDTRQNTIAWRAQLASRSSVNFIASSPYENLLIVGGRFSQSGGSNLNLLDAGTGEVIRPMLGVENVDVNSSSWVDRQVLVSHSTLTDRIVTENSIIDRGYLKGTITWHDVESGRLLSSVDSPLYVANVIEQSTDGQMVTLAGFEGAAVVDNHTHEVVFSLRFSDIYGPEYRDCSNFGCGASRSGFSQFDISADRRVFAVTTASGPIYVGDAQERRIAFDIQPKNTEGQNLYIRKIKIDPAAYLLYVYAAEKFVEPSIAWVLIYNLVDGTIVRAHQGDMVPGISGGNDAGSIFSKDFKYLITSDSADGIADSRMLRPAQFRTYAIE